MKDDNIVISKYYRPSKKKGKRIYDTDSIREEFEIEVAKLEKNNKELDYE